MESLLENIKCPICLEVYEGPQSLACRHVYCAGCLAQLKVTSVNVSARRRSSTSTTGSVRSNPSSARSNSETSSRNGARYRIVPVNANTADSTTLNSGVQFPYAVITCPLCRQQSGLEEIRADFNIANIIKALRLSPMAEYNGNANGAIAVMRGECIPTAPPLYDEEVQENGHVLDQNEYFANERFRSTVVPSAPYLDSDDNYYYNGSKEVSNHTRMHLVKRKNTPFSLRQISDPIVVKASDNCQLALIKDRPALVEHDQVLMLTQGNKLVQWYGDPVPKGYCKARDCVRIGNDYVLCCADADFGLMHFSESGKFKYYVSESNYTAVTTDRNDRLVALDASNKQLTVFRYSKSDYDDGKMPWRKLNSICLPTLNQGSYSHQHMDLVLCRDQLYILHTKYGKLWHYSLDGGYIGTYTIKTQNSNSVNNFCAKLVCFSERYLLFTTDRQDIHVHDIITGQQHVLALYGGEMSNRRILSFCCSQNQLWLLNKRGNAFELATYSLEEL